MFQVMEVLGFSIVWSALFSCCSIKTFLPINFFALPQMHENLQKVKSLSKRVHSLILNVYHEEKIAGDRTPLVWKTT